MPIIDPKTEDEFEEYGGMMGSMMLYEVVFKFDKPVKKVSNKDYIISPDGKTITYKSNFEDIFKGLLNSSVTIKR